MISAGTHHAFCAERSRSRREMFFGTASRVDTWLLIERPSAWSARAFPDEALTLAERDHIRRTTKAIPHCRPLMIRQSVRPLADRKCFISRSAEVNSRVSVLSFGNDDDLSAIDSATLDQVGGAMWSEPLYLVCTHGKHDKCCAKFGHATYQAMRALVKAQAWECSHVGGDRFAANVVCLPHGIYYGNVTPEDAFGIVEAYQRGEICLKHYRGRSCYSRVAQIGEYFIRSESGSLGLDDFLFISSEPLGSGWRVDFMCRSTGRIHQTEFSASESEFPELLTCRSTTAQRVSQYRLRAYGVRVEGEE